MDELKEFIDDIKGMRVEGGLGSRVVVFEQKPTLEYMAHLVELLRKFMCKIDLYDPVYPSPSDPGAYMAYAQTKAQPGRWSMSLGNHGWSGGIYQIDDQTLAQQLFSLNQHGHLHQLRIDQGRLFANYTIEDEEKSQGMMKQLRTIHPIN